MEATHGLNGLGKSKKEVVARLRSVFDAIKNPNSNSQSDGALRGYQEPQPEVGEYLFQQSKAVIKIRLGVNARLKSMRVVTVIRRIIESLNAQTGVH